MACLWCISYNMYKMLPMQCLHISITERQANGDNTKQLAIVSLHMVTTGPDKQKIISLVVNFLINMTDLWPHTSLSLGCDLSCSFHMSQGNNYNSLNCWTIFVFKQINTGVSNKKKKFTSLDQSWSLDSVDNNIVFTTNQLSDILYMIKLCLSDYNITFLLLYDI